MDPFLCVFKYKFQDMMKVRLQEAMPDVPLHELREQREMYEKQEIEPNDDQEQMHNNPEVGPDDEQEQIYENHEGELDNEDKGPENGRETHEAGAAADIEVQYDEENDVTFQSNITGTKATIAESGFSGIKLLKNIFKRSRSGLRRCNVNHGGDGTKDVTVEDEYDVQHGGDIASESDSEGDYQEGLPLIRLRHDGW